MVVEVQVDNRVRRSVGTLVNGLTHITHGYIVQLQVIGGFRLREE
jgi:hypothetical protein